MAVCYLCAVILKKLPLLYRNRGNGIGTTSSGFYMDHKNPTIYTAHFQCVWHTASIHKTLGIIVIPFKKCSIIKAYCFYATVMDNTAMIIFVQMVYFLCCVISSDSFPGKA